jgi:hypothetical protein
MTLRELISQVRAYLAREYADKNMLGPNVLRDYDIIVAINHAYKLFLDSTYLLEDDDTKTFTDGIYNCSALNLQELIRVEIDNAAIGYVRFKDCADTLKIDNDIIDDTVPLSLSTAITIIRVVPTTSQLLLSSTLDYEYAATDFIFRILSSLTYTPGVIGSFVSISLSSSLTYTVY